MLLRSKDLTLKKIKGLNKIIFDEFLLLWQPGDVKGAQGYWNFCLILALL